MMSGRPELWNRKVSHFPATRTEETSTALFTITADSSHSAHSWECLIFLSRTMLGPNHAHAVPKEPASLLSPQLNGACWWQKEESSFQYSRMSCSIRTPREKTNIWSLPCPWGYLLSFLLQLSQGITSIILGAGVAHALWEGLTAEGDADPDLKRNSATWEKAGGEGGNKSSSVWLWRLVWLMALFGWLCVRMFPSHYPCCMKSKKRKRDRKVGRGLFCKVKTISQRWFKPLLKASKYNKKFPTTSSSLQP